MKRWLIGAAIAAGIGGLLVMAEQKHTHDAATWSAQGPTAWLPDSLQTKLFVYTMPDGTRGLIGNDGWGGIGAMACQWQEPASPADPR